MRFRSIVCTGVGSSVKEVQALSLVTVSEMVKHASPQQLRPHLATLIPALLESLSGMEVIDFTRTMHLRLHACACMVCA